MRSVALALCLLTSGCWRLEDPLASYEIIPLENQHVANPDLVVQTFEPTSPLLCPRGEEATFYAVYDQTLTGQVPLAVLLHSGAFDYVKNPAMDDPLGGTHYAADDRLDLEWAQLRVFSTLGMWDPDVDPSEVHTGALVTALAQNGVMVLLPANCWGDLWHGYYWQDGRENDYDTEQFERYGLAAAAYMVRNAIDAEFAVEHGLLPLDVDPERIALVGLGEGGRGVGELLWWLAESVYSDTRVSAVMVDSSPDYQGYYLGLPGAFADEITGLERIWDGATDRVDAYSLQAFLSQTQYPRPRTMVVWSTYDPAVPADTLTGLVDTVAALAETAPDSYLVDGIAASAHVHSNADMPLAFDVVDFLFP